jgi:transcriptional regulator with XRE-family HTH domain
MCDPNLKPGALIRQRRVALGMTQDALAERVGVNTGTLARVEHGRNAGWLTIVALLQAVGVEVIVR